MRATQQHIPLKRAKTEEHGALHRYVLQAEEKYAVAKRVQEESSLGKRLWGEGEA